MSRGTVSAGQKWSSLHQAVNIRGGGGVVGTNRLGRDVYPVATLSTRGVIDTDPNLKSSVRHPAVAKGDGDAASHGDKRGVNMGDPANIGRRDTPGRV